jgi:hypothetical protein
MRVFHQWEGISLRQYDTAQDHEDERRARVEAQEAMKGRLARESKLFQGAKLWHICACGCQVWLLPGNETGRHLDADEVVQGLEQYRPTVAGGYNQIMLVHKPLGDVGGRAQPAIAAPC